MDIHIVTKTIFQALKLQLLSLYVVQKQMREVFFVLLFYDMVCILLVH